MFYFFPSLSLLLGCGLCEGRDFVCLVCCAPALGEVWKEPPAVGEKRTLSLGSRLPPPPPPLLVPPPGISYSSCPSSSWLSFHDLPWKRPISPGHLSHPAF